jgi:hypothetical protein
MGAGGIFYPLFVTKTPRKMKRKGFHPFFFMSLCLGGSLWIAAAKRLLSYCWRNISQQ